VYDSDKEGIDISQTSKQGKVHHNLVHNLPRQGIYIDAWVGSIKGIDVFSNVVHDCGGVGLVLSVENGHSVEDVKIHNNLVFGNEGSGLLFSHWGVNNPRRHIEIYNNVFYHNGYGPPEVGQTYYWLTGGLYLDSTNISDLSITRNIFSDNRGFQIGFNELLLRDSRSWAIVARDKNIRIADNLINGRNTISLPIEGGGNPADRTKIYAVNGQRPIFADPRSKDAAGQDFSLRRGWSAMVGSAVVGA
jgi:hypothetical protein